MSGSNLRSDIKVITRDAGLLAAALAPLFIILFMRFVFPPVSDQIFMKTGFHLDIYYTIFAITLISAVPVLSTLVYAFICLNNNGLHDIRVSLPGGPELKDFFFGRIMVAMLIGFFLVFITILFTDPVPAEGWLRAVFISMLLSLQAPFVILFKAAFAGGRAKGTAIRRIYGIFLAAVPLGLILHHPLNYLAFFSPLYWISWSFVIHSATDSFFYGAISAIITFGCYIWFYSKLLKKKKF
jgi:fluoroquinolone transport system permease protein